MATMFDALARAVEYHQSGRLGLAEQIYRQVLTVAPHEADALHLLGVVVYQQGKYRAAIELLQQAVQVKPHEAAFQQSLGLAFKAIGDLEQAIAAYRRALELAPRSAEIHNNLGVALRAQGKLDEALACYDRALELDSRSAEIHYNLGAVLSDQGKLEEAVATYRRALELKSDFAEAHNNLGNVLRRQGKLPEAAACYRRAGELRPGYADAHHNLGLVLHEQRDLDGALRCYRQALELRPAYPEAFLNLGRLWRDQHNFDEAVACYRRAVELDPRQAMLHYNLGLAYQEQGRLDEAVASCRRALELDPECHAAYNNLANALKDLGLLDEALAAYEQALRLKPDFAVAHSNRLLALEYRGGLSVGQLTDAYQEFDRRHGRPLRGTWRPHNNAPRPGKTLRLGFLSADFGRAPVGHFYLRPLECLRAEDCEIICYSTRRLDDDVAARFRSAAHRWRDADSLSDHELAEQIRADGVDILFDLNCHTAGNRLAVLARKPAPIQIAWSGPNGLSAMNYLLADACLTPNATELCGARVLRMPDAYVCYGPPASAPEVNRLPALQRGQVTFASLNNPAKVTPEVIRLWAEVLRRVPNARLLMQYFSIATNPSLQSRWHDAFAAEGIATERVELVGRVGRRLDLYHEVDLALDPFPFSGSTTTCESLWMGVPVITLPQETYYSRASLTMLHHAGLDPCVAADQADYVDRAARLAHDLPRLAELRAGLRAQLATSPLCDASRFAANLMHLLRSAWCDWCTRETRR
jgi:predicted O-linked N-acetylglucosamine transferase (SPINDLY family)